jgi:carboxypeptidase PM20D1
MSFGMRIVFANRWLFNRLILSQLESKKSTAASVRTTTAPTIFNAGTKENVIPANASAILNFRILPGETGQSVQKRVEEVLNDKRIIVSLEGSHADDPSPVSPTQAFGFLKIQETIAEVFPDVITAPYLMLGATDARHYAPICKNLYRFQPTCLADADLNRIHGINERVSISNYKETVRFYVRLIENSCK